MTLSSAQTVQLFDRYVIGNYNRFPVCLVKGEGCRVGDADGKRSLDFLPGWRCDLIGHSPTRAVDAIREQAGQLLHVPHTCYTEPQRLLAQALSQRTRWGGKCFFCNSGADANEAAIKLARLCGKPR